MGLATKSAKPHTSLGQILSHMRRICPIALGGVGKMGKILGSESALTRTGVHHMIPAMKSLTLLTTLVLMQTMSLLAGPIEQIPIKDIDGKDTSLNAYKGKVLLVVNVASKCGLTPQYKALEALQEKYKAKGFTILGFPCNQFAGQEPGSNEEI